MYDRGLPCKFPWLKHLARQWFSHTVDNFLCSVIIHSLYLKLKPSNLLNKALDVTLDVKKKLSTENSLSFYHAILGGKMR